VPEAIRYMLQIAAAWPTLPSGASSTATSNRAHYRQPRAAGQARRYGTGPQSGAALRGWAHPIGRHARTFDYISPEQAWSRARADVRSDIYSLGCTFYHLLTGHAPVPEGTAAKKLHHHQHVARSTRDNRPSIPDEVAAILARMMAKDPKDRYQRSEHLVQHLLLVAQKLGPRPTCPMACCSWTHRCPAAWLRPVLMAAVAARRWWPSSSCWANHPGRHRRRRNFSRSSASRPRSSHQCGGRENPGRSSMWTRRRRQPLRRGKPAPTAVYDAARPAASELEAFLRKEKVAKVSLVGDVNLKDEESTMTGTPPPSSSTARVC